MIDGIRNGKDTEVYHPFGYVERICAQKKQRQANGPRENILGLRFVFLSQILYEIDKSKRKREQCDKMMQHKIDTYGMLQIAI